MESSERIRTLQSLMEEDPNDPFLLYALCLEQSRHSAETGLSAWEGMLNRFPDYLPSYYHAGLAFRQSGNREKALSIWNLGIALATKTNDRHALTELKTIYQNTLLEEEEEE